MEVTNHIILFLDVMGYKSHIKSFGFDIEMQNQYLAKVHTLMKDLSRFITCRNEYVDKNLDSYNCLKLTRFKWITFSDNIMFFAPYNYDVDAYNLTYNLLYGLSEFFMQYEWDDIFLRGGLTKGQLYFDNDLHFVFGSGLVKAYELEGEAFAPRIKLDYSLNSSPIIVGVEQDSNGDWYFDYLKLFYARFYHGKNEEQQRYFFQCLQSHKKNIIKAIKKFGDIKELLQKYEWLKKYHNDFCYRFKFDNYMIDN